MINEINNDAKNRMKKTCLLLESNFSKIRAGRANTSILEHIQVEYYGSMVVLSQVANLVTEDARTIKISPWEQDMVGPIEKAIMTSDIGLNPNTSGQIIRVVLPPLTEERRKELVRIVRDEAENTKISIRNIRRDVMTDIKELLKEKEISEDESRKAENSIQNITDEHIKDIDELLQNKEKSLLEI